MFCVLIFKNKQTKNLSTVLVKNKKVRYYFLRGPWTSYFSLAFVTYQLCITWWLFVHLPYHPPHPTRLQASRERHGSHFHPRATKNNHIPSSSKFQFLCIHWLIVVCVLTGDKTHDLGVSRKCSNQLSCSARPIYILNTKRGEKFQNIKWINGRVEVVVSASGVNRRLESWLQLQESLPVRTT